VWLWDWQEGLAETLATFRAAADFCEEFEEFVFCHNEAVLYQWVETFEPELFHRIKNLVEKGHWAIIGGWYLQPDCNLPSGESFVRQALVGKRYFREKFGVEPRTAVNFDPFGHSRGLVQILKKSGYDSYLFCRPDPESYPLPEDDFIWVGYDGSEITAHRASQHYNSQRGQAARKVARWLELHPDKPLGLLLWGIGNHGGGPSREDLGDLRRLQQDHHQKVIKHGTPEEYFSALIAAGTPLPRHERDLNPWAVGCYTSMARVKAGHRCLENQLVTTERMLTQTAVLGLISYPRQELLTVLQDLLFCEFHDILPGSAIAEVEASTLQRLDHGREILDRLKTRAFFALLNSQAPAQAGEFPVCVYNPHPFAVEQTIVCEFQPPEPNFNADIFWLPEVQDEKGAVIASQLEQESSNISVDQRKRIVFRAILPPGQMSRFPVYLRDVKPGKQSYPDVVESVELKGKKTRMVINPNTGLIDSFQVDGRDYLQAGACRLLVMKDYPDPWGMKVNSFRDLVGSYHLLTPAESAKFAGSDREEMPPVRIIEDGPVRTVVEALFGFERSYACLHYILPKAGDELEVKIRVFWNEKDRMLKLSIPTCFEQGRCRGQVAYGTELFNRDAEELVAQKWVAQVSADQGDALTLSNDRTYGFDVSNGEIRPSLLRSAAYAAHPVADDIPIVEQDRFIPRIDQGEHVFRFWIQGGPASERLERIGREAAVSNEPPTALCCFPTGQGKKPLPVVTLQEDGIELTALKLAEDSDRIILRLFNPLGEGRRAQIELPLFELSFDLEFGPFEIKTLAVDPRTKKVVETNLLEREI
jgi:alpha-mannosidase